MSTREILAEILAELKAMAKSERERFRAGCFWLSESRLLEFRMVGIIRTPLLDGFDGTSFCIL